MSARARVGLVVSALAAGAAAVTVGATLLTAGGETTATGPVPRAGVPPLVLDLGVRTDPEARALRRAVGLYERRRRAAAARVFARYDSVEARVGAAMASWPDGARELERLADAAPASGAAQLNVGLARFWLGDADGARAAWRQAGRVEPDSVYAVRAGDLLHPEYPVPGLPVFVPSFPTTAGLARLSPPAQLALLARRARAGGAREKLAYGVALQRLSRPISARRELDSAAALAPRDPEALTAAAVARFRKDDPSAAFSRLGPLARRYPKAATVRFHLGLLLLWLGRVDEARAQLRRAVAVEPGSVPARQAKAFLARLK